MHLQGRVEPGRDCTGSVMLDGKALPCNDDNGYRVKDDGRSLELFGGACATLQTASAPTLQVTFPCEDVTLF